MQIVLAMLLMSVIPISCLSMSEDPRMVYVYIKEKNQSQPRKIEKYSSQYLPVKEIKIEIDEVLIDKEFSFAFEIKDHSEILDPMKSNLVPSFIGDTNRFQFSYEISHQMLKVRVAPKTKQPIQSIASSRYHEPAAEQDLFNAVGMIESNGRTCVGFIIGPGLVMTNHHCIQSNAECKATTIHLSNQSSSKRFDCKEITSRNRYLDYVVFRTIQDPSISFGQLHLSQAKMETQSESSVKAISHAQETKVIQECPLMKNGLSNDLNIICENARECRLTTLIYDCKKVSISEGFSGSPIIQANGEVVGMIWGYMLNRSTKKKIVGVIPAWAILDSLSKKNFSVAETAK